MKRGCVTTLCGYTPKGEFIVFSTKGLQIVLLKENKVLFSLRVRYIQKEGVP